MRRCVIADKLIQYQAINGSRRGKGLWSCKAGDVLMRHVWLHAGKTHLNEISQFYRSENNCNRLYYNTNDVRK